jgi:hypothetical protein
VQVNVELAQLPGERSARTWIGDEIADPIPFGDGRAEVRVPAKGLLSLAIPDANIQTRIQEAMLDPEAPRLTNAQSETFESYLGNIRVTPLSYGKGLTTVHLLVVAGPEDLRDVVLTYTLEGEKHTMTSAGYPHEFTVPVPDSLKEFEFAFDSIRADGIELNSGPRKVQLQ